MGLQANIIYENYHGTSEYFLNTNVYVAITDDTTGLPANGDNTIVYYQVTERTTDAETGAFTETNEPREVTVSGQSQLIDASQNIYTYLLNSSGIYVKIYERSYIVTGVSNTPDPSPPVNLCDLQITSISVDRSASAPGSGDAQITVNAFSSYLPILFSLDNDTFQTSNIFTNVTGGLKTVYVTDANSVGCAASKTVNIPVLTNLLVKDPSVTIGGNISRWNAAFNPIVFTYQRKDFEVNGVSLDTATGNAKLSVNADLTTLVDDDLVYVNAGVYKGVYKAKKNTINTLVIDTPYLANDLGFININRLRPYYKLLTEVTYQDIANGQEKKITATNRPDNTGLIRADIANFLQSLVRVKDDSNFTQVNFRDANLSASYQIRYAEHWDDTSTEGHTSEWIAITDPYYVVYAAKQLGEHYGGNLAAYVPFATVINGTPLARWITDFAEPAYSNTYPFDISFIYSEDLLGLALYCEVTLLDINRTPLPGGAQTSYLLNEDNSWLLMQDGSKFIIANQTVTNAPLAAQLGLNRLLINGNFPADAYYFTIALKYDDDAEVTHTVIQTQTVRIDDAVDDRSVYLRWIGLSGAWNYYRFVYNQEISLDVQNATIIKNYVSDWENQESIEEVISKTAGQKMKVMAEDLSVNDIKGLQSIKYSPKVQMLVNKNPVKWQTVVLNTATFNEYETRNGQGPFSVTFNLPGINIQTQ